MTTKINRNQTIKIILVLSTILIIALTAIIITQPSQTIDESIYDAIIQFPQAVSDDMESTCNWSNYHDPMEFKRIYY